VEISTFGLGNQPHLLADLYGLRPAPRAQLVEETAGVSLNSVFTDEEFVGDFAVAQSLRHQFENLELTPGDAEEFQALLI
jgi:hypothetical protein